MLDYFRYVRRHMQAGSRKHFTQYAMVIMRSKLFLDVYF